MTTTRPALLALALALALPAAARGGDGPIQDNSFLLEEAYNQEPGVIQHISAFSRASAAPNAWVYTFTEEWPVRGQTHQASVTLAFNDFRAGDTRGLGDVLLNYRWQAVGNGEEAVALAPRLSLALPTGDEKKGLGSGAAGVEVNLPLSVVLAPTLVTHVNLGGRYTPSAAIGPLKADLTTWFFGQSFIWLAHSNFNVMLEAIYSSSEARGDGFTGRTESLFVNPGVRAAIDVGDLQIVPGLAFPIGVGPSRGDKAVFLYLSLEHPFRLAGPTEPEKT
ncbi:MAG: hypothetical protein QM704_22115 [Anaeromyxobacteraceae bacterium]